ncbi:MAG: YdcF family protein [Patescibacteria group bacterium]|jgi:uncharacterized SAM-binding protein YcdF (DUF218 family)
MVPVDQLGPDTLMRCEKALELWRTGQFGCLVVTGGRCHPSYVETRSAAESMQVWFDFGRVPLSCILVEPEAKDTFGNAISTVAGLQHWGIDTDNITVVSHWLHCVRLRITFRLACRVRVKTVPLYYPIGWKGAFAEVAMICYHVLDRKGNGWIARRNRAKRTFSKPS